jgi:hypothetical protein
MTRNMICVTLEDSITLILSFSKEPGFQERLNYIRIVRN